MFFEFHATIVCVFFLAITSYICFPLMLQQTSQLIFLNILRPLVFYIFKPGPEFEFKLPLLSQCKSASNTNDIMKQMQFIVTLILLKLCLVSTQINIQLENYNRETRNKVCEKFFQYNLQCFYYYAPTLVILLD